MLVNANRVMTAINPSSDAVEALEDAGPDLIDYCVGCITNLGRSKTKFQLKCLQLMKKCLLYYYHSESYD